MRTSGVAVTLAALWAAIAYFVETLGDPGLRVIVYGGMVAYLGVLACIAGKALAYRRAAPKHDVIDV